MNNLIPEQRADKNGNLVTRHVRATPKQGTQRSAMPQPSLGASSSTRGAKKAFKPRKAQLEQHQISHNVDRYPFDQRLVTDASEKEAERERGSRYYSSYYVFKASEVEVYDVLSVAPVGEALRMLSRDIRTADEARAYLTEHGVADLILDRRDTMNEALEKNVSHYDFVSKYEDMDDKKQSSDHLVDCVRFASSSLSEGLNGTLIDQIASGRVSFDDIKAVGITRLKSHNRAYSLANAFEALNNGEGDYTIDGIKTLVDKASKEVLDSRELSYVCRAMKEIGLEATNSFKELKTLANAYHFYNIAPGSNKYEGNSKERSIYAARLHDGTNNRILSVNYSDAFFEADIPVDKAVDVINRGGGLREAIAIHEEGIQGSVAGGWL
jgi:hypothetical protein